MGKYFGTDGIRSEVGGLLNSELAFKIGYHLKEAFKETRLVIGLDTRESSEALAYSLASGALSAGMDVIMAGVVSTPMIAYYAKAKKMTGVMVTASHNPFTDNGIKVFDQGYKPLESKELVLEALIDGPLVLQNTRFGKLTKSAEVSDFYLSLYTPLNLEKMHFSVGFDSANGANTWIAKKLLTQVCDESHQIHGEPDGRNINLNCGSTHVDVLRQFLLEKSLDIGLSFDGDGDRVLVLDQKGTLYDGDLIVYAMAKYLKSLDALKKNTVVLTQMSNPGIIKAFKALGIKTVRTNVGDKYVTEEIMKNGYSIGGENSGHIILHDHIHTGDGLFVGIFLLNLLHKQKISLHQYVEEVTLFPQKLVNIKNVNKEVLETKAYKNLEASVKKKLGQECLLLVRASGTEPLVRVTVSHQDESLMEEVIQELVNGIVTLNEEEQA